MRLTQITPSFCCSYPARTIGFDRDALEFTLGFQAGKYAFLWRDDVAIRLFEGVYTNFKDLDALYQKMKPACDALPEGRVRLALNQDDGQREFHALNPEGMLVFFGEATIA